MFAADAGSDIYTISRSRSVIIFTNFISSKQKPFTYLEKVQTNPINRWYIIYVPNKKQFEFVINTEIICNSLYFKWKRYARCTY